MPKLPDYSVLGFSYDDDNACALVVRVHDRQYHIAATPSAICTERSRSGKKINREYQRLLGQVKEVDQGDGAEGTAPLFVQEDEDDDETEERDSAVDVATPEEEQDGDHPTEPSKALERWMLSPLADIFSDHESNAKRSQVLSIEDWYLCPTHYFDLVVQNGKLSSRADESPSSDLRKRIEMLVPSMPLFKYLTDLDTPIFRANDLAVLRESADPVGTPLHPCLVSERKTKKEFFLKLVDRGQLQPMNKRELQVMKQIEAKGLHNELRVPLLRGLVQFSHCLSHSHKDKGDIMGFLLDPISDPTPLTQMLDTEVPEEKRLKWAEESARMVDLLHQNGIVWGDAKGDNFMVDANDDLWIIDFGGSYTEGWVDEELKETEDGDHQGVRKLQNGLRDPEKYTISEDEETQEDRRDRNEQEPRKEEDDESSDEKVHNGAVEADNTNLKSTTKAKRQVHDTCEGWEEVYESEQKKRKRSSSSAASAKPSGQKKRKAAVVGQDEQRPSKQQKNQENEPDEDEPKYCYCGGPESDEMIACDGNNCQRQWFHFSCAGIDEVPRGKWLCKICRREGRMA